MKSVKHTSGFDIPQPAEKLFPLFSPEGEKLWVLGWDYQDIMGTAGFSEDYVFLTKNHDHASADAIWIVKKYDPESFLVQFYKIEPEDKIGIVTVQCFRRDNGFTHVQVSYEYIALSAKGGSFIESFNKEAYEKFIGVWKVGLLKYYESQNNKG